MLKFKHSINTIFIMLGTECNLSCKYCMQHSLVQEKIPKRNLDKRIIEFISEQSKSQEHPIDIRFYGGEPLLYFDDIMEIVLKLKQSEANVKFSIISNGKKLSQKNVDFMNENEFMVAISWDGKNVTKTRMFDVIGEKGDLVLQLKNLCIDAVISSYTYPLDFFSSLVPFENEYNKVHGKFFPAMMDEVMDTGIVLSELTDINFDEVFKQNNQIIDIAISNIESPEGALEFLCRSYFFSQLRKINLKIKRDENCFCGNAVWTINIDLNGNLHQCHNNWNKIGNIFNDTYDEYMQRARINEDICKNRHEKECLNCTAESICLAGCPIISDEAREKTGYCNLKRASMVPYIGAASMLLDMANKKIDEAQNFV